MRSADPIFAHPRLAAVNDAFDGDRHDLTAYLGIADELGAQRVLDVGCGTGCLAVLLASGGRAVVAVDPAEASLRVADPYRFDWAGTSCSRPGARNGGCGKTGPLTEVNLPFVSFRYVYRFLADGSTLTSDSTLRFRGRHELVFLAQSPFTVGRQA